MSENRAGRDTPDWPLADLAAAAATGLAAVGASAVAIYAVEPDDSLVLVGSAGVPDPVVAAWSRVSAQLTTAAVDAARHAAPVWLPDLDTARRRYVLIGDPDVVWRSRAMIPIHGDERPVAVVGVFWPQEQRFTTERRAAVTGVVDDLTERIAERLRTHPYRAGWIADAQVLLDGLPGGLAVLVPIRDRTGTTVDYVVVAAAPEAVDISGRRGRALIGSSVVEQYPTIVGSDLWEAYAQVLRTGRPREVGPFDYADTTEGIDAEAVYTVRASRLGAGLLVAWVRHDEQRRFAARLADTERLGKLGWGEWDMVTDHIVWSDGLLAIFERDAAGGPVTFEEGARYIHPQDAPRVAPVLESFFATGTPIDIAYRIVVPSGVKHIQCRFEARRDPVGRVLRVHGLVVDVTERVAAERLADVEAELADRRRSQQVEHRLVTALQQIILPLPAGVLEPTGLRVAVRYQPAEETSRVGGDWYDVVALPNGRTLLVVGDVAGHGITAAATMARLRHSVAALAVTSTDPAELLGYLNVLVCDDDAEPTATVVVARFDPATCTVAWAQAGHPPPIVVAGHEPAALARPSGMIVGARRDSVYENATLTLTPGDTMLLYTDGLIERRQAPDDDWLGPLLGALRGTGSLAVDQLLARLQPANPADDTCVLALRPS